MERRAPVGTGGTEEVVGKRPLSPACHSRSNPRHRWAAARGGNRLAGLHAKLIGDRASTEKLPANSPRRRPTLAALRFLADPDGGAR